MEPGARKFDKKILLVEDEALLREELFAVLTGEGYQVETAVSGALALDMIRRDRFDAVILDIVLSVNKADVQGSDVLAELKARPEQTPVIVISNKASDRALARLVQTGFYEFISKSLILNDIGNLLAPLQAALRNGPVSFNRLPRFPANLDGFVVLRGMASEMHFMLRKHLLEFEQYLLQFKGIATKVEAVSIPGYDDMLLRFGTAGDPAIFGLFREFVEFAYADDPQRIDPAFEAAAPPAERAALTERLRDQVGSFARNVTHIFNTTWRDLSHFPPMENGPEVLEINTYKISNAVLAKNRSYANQRLVVAVRDLTRLMYDKLVDDGPNQTSLLGALEELLDFCTRYEFDGPPRLESINLQAWRLRSQLKSALNDWNTGRITQAGYFEERSRILVVLLFEVIPDLEQLYRDHPASGDLSQVA
jgi:DNA-binding response OmpR family regulator